MPAKRRLCACGCGVDVAYSTQARHLQGKGSLGTVLDEILDARRQSDQKSKSNRRERGSVKRGKRRSRTQRQPSPPVIEEDPDITMNDLEEPDIPAPAGSDTGTPRTNSPLSTTRRSNRIAAAHIALVARGRWGNTHGNPAPRALVGDRSEGEEEEQRIPPSEDTSDSDEWRSEEEEGEGDDWWSVEADLGDSQVPIQQQLSEEFYRKAAAIGGCSMTCLADNPHSSDVQERMLSRMKILAFFELTLSRLIVASPTSHSISSDMLFRPYT